MQERLKTNPELDDSADLAVVRKQIREQVKAEYQLVPPAYSREWQIDLGFAKNYLHDKPLQLRVKFNAAQRKCLRHIPRACGRWAMPKSPSSGRDEPMSLAPDTFHEFPIPPNLFDTKAC